MRSKVHVAWAVIACALVCACDDAPAPKAEPGTAVDAKPKAKTLALPANMVAAVPAGRGAPAVTVHFALEAQPAVGISLPVKIAIVPRREFSSLKASFQAADGVIMSSGEDLPSQEKVEAEKVFDHQLVLQPTREGVFMVTVAVETEGDDGSVTRIYSIPLIVHAPKATAGAGANPAAAPRT